MSEQQRRKDLVAEYQRSGTEAGVYRIVDTTTGKALFGVSTNLRGMANRVEFARSTRAANGFDGRLHADIAAHGIDAFAFEVVDTLETKPEMTDAEIRADLDALLELSTEGIDPALRY